MGLEIDFLRIFLVSLVLRRCLVVSWRGMFRPRSMFVFRPGWIFFVSVNSLPRGFFPLAGVGFFVVVERRCGRGIGGVRFFFRGVYV